MLDQVLAVLLHFVADFEHLQVVLFLEVGHLPVELLADLGQFLVVLGF